MIPRAHITAWRSKAPWSTDAQVEQDLIVCRTVAELYSDEALGREIAFRGGTALHKLHFESPGRYSEDIDLVQVNAGPIGPMLKAIRARLDSWLGLPQWKQSRGLVTLYYRFESETRPVTRLKLKVEINTREHFLVLGERRIRFEIANPWFERTTNVLSYEPEELLATKLRALYQRKKGRDLFDLSEALIRIKTLDPDKVIFCFERYLANDGRRVTRAQFERNLAAKINDDVFLSDVPPVLTSGVSFDPRAALQRIQEAFISRLSEGSSRGNQRRGRA